MDSLRRRKSSGIVGFCVLSVALWGCTSADLIARKDSEISDLRSEKSRLEDSLSQAISKVDRLRDEVKNTLRDKRAAEEETEELRKRLQFANEQLEVAARDRGKLETKLNDAEAQAAMLERSLAKVKDVASDSVSELTDLRMRAQNFKEDVTRLRSENETLTRDRDKLQSEVSSQHEQLTKLKAVLRALRSGSKEKELQDSIVQLEKEAADLRGENLVLSRRIENLQAREAELSQALAKQAKGSEGTMSAAVSGTPPAEELVYISDPNGLYDEVVGFAAARYRRALTGDVEWDLFDIAVVASSTLILALLVTHLLRSRRIRKLKRQIEDLRDELCQLEEEAQAGGDDYVEEEEDRPARGPRKKPPLRRGGFSAVIAGPGGPASAPSEAAPSPPSGEVEERVPETVAARSPAPRPAASPPPAAPPRPADAEGGDDGSRRVIGARTWEDEESLSLDEESLERTQLIQLSPEELGSENLIVPSPVPSPKPKPKPPEASSEDKENKTTQIEKGPDLLEELKSAVNEKLDKIT